MQAQNSEMEKLEWGIGLKLKKCASCGKFTMKEQHCGQPASSAHPAKFSFQDKYAAYRRKTKYG